MKQLKCLLVALIFSFSAFAQVGQQETISSNEHEIYYTHQSSTSASAEIRRYTPIDGEAGLLMIYYNAVDGSATPNQATRIKFLQFVKSQTGVVTIKNPQQVYSFNNTGWNSVDFSVSASNGAINIFVVGLNGVAIRHTIKIEKVSNSLLFPVL